MFRHIVPLLLPVHICRGRVLPYGNVWKGKVDIGMSFSTAFLPYFVSLLPELTLLGRQSFCVPHYLDLDTRCSQCWGYRLALSHLACTSIPRIQTLLFTLAQQVHYLLTDPTPQMQMLSVFYMSSIKLISTFFKNSTSLKFSGWTEYSYLISHNVLRMSFIPFPNSVLVTLWNLLCRIFTFPSAFWSLKVSLEWPIKLCL